MSNDIEGIAGHSGEPAARLSLRRGPLRTAAIVCGLWVLSDIGFYFLLPSLGYASSYNEDPAAGAIFYLYWVGVSVILLWPVLATWPDHARWRAFGNPALSVGIWTLLLALAVLYVSRVVPALPHFDATDRIAPPDMPQANAWYFLPKSIDILFQQVLIAALVLSLAQSGTRLKRISLLCGGLFGVTHLLLLLGGGPIGYTLRFTGFAAVFGLVFPVLFLRVPNGFAFSYAAHWSFYAAAIAVARLW